MMSRKTRRVMSGAIIVTMVVTTVTCAIAYL